MKGFFSVADLGQVLSMAGDFETVDTESIPLLQAVGRVLAGDIVSEEDLPPFARSTMDGYAVAASATYGAGEANPAYLEVVGDVAMGNTPDMRVGAGQAAKIATGGMLPPGADSVVMVEHTAAIDDRTIEVYKSAAPGQHIVAKGEDFAAGTQVLPSGRRLRPQETGLLAALGRDPVTVYRNPVVGIISTGDELVPVDRKPEGGQIRDVNTYSLAGLLRGVGAEPRPYGIVKDDLQALISAVSKAYTDCDAVLISGGSSVGMRDLTIQAFSALPDTRILTHGIAIRPGKPTILAASGGRMLWGLPGHVVSAMVVFQVVVRPFIERIGGVGEAEAKAPCLAARLSRNLASAQGRVDYVRVRLIERDGFTIAEPVMGKSALIHSMVRADGLVMIEKDTEGLEKGAKVEVIPI